MALLEALLLPFSESEVHLQPTEVADGARSYQGGRVETEVTRTDRAWTAKPDAALDGLLVRLELPVDLLASLSDVSGLGLSLTSLQRAASGRLCLYGRATDEARRLDPLDVSVEPV